MEVYGWGGCDHRSPELVTIGVGEAAAEDNCENRESEKSMHGDWFVGQ